MNNSIYNFKSNPKSETEEMKNLVKCYEVLYSLLTEIQRERLQDNYDKYKDHEKEPVEFYLYCLRHLELSVVR